MTQEEYLKRFEEKCKADMELTRRKNADYAGTENAFKNFELIEYLTAGRISAAEGLLVRMSDKLIRFANLLSRAAQVKDETITDTLDDLSVYAKITSIVLEEQGQQEPAPDAASQPATWGRGMNVANSAMNTPQANLVQTANLGPHTENTQNFFVEWLNKMREAA